jgi:serine/threonine protein kinase
MPKSHPQNVVHKTILPECYELSKTVLGGGSYGTVTLGRHWPSREQIAVKFQDGQAPELIALRHIGSHPNVVPLLHAAFQKGISALVFPFFRCDLGKYIRMEESQLTTGVVRRIACQILQGVRYCHGRGIVHCDMKPENVLVDGHQDDCRVVLADFGLSVSLSPTSGLTVPVDRDICTLPYRAPELLCGASVYSFPIDLWGVGCIMVELALGTRVFHEARGTKIGTLFKIFEQLGTPTLASWPGYRSTAHYSQSFPQWAPGKLQSALPHWLLHDDGVALILDCLCLDPERRLSANAATLHRYFNRREIAVEYVNTPPTQPHINGDQKSLSATVYSAIVAVDFIEGRFQTSADYLVAPFMCIAASGE